MLPKLYKIQRRENGTVLMVYTGRHCLPGRRFSKGGRWTDESVFDHMGLGEDGDYY